MLKQGSAPTGQAQTRIRRAASGSLLLSMSLLLTSSCAFGPRSPVSAKNESEADEFAEKSAYAGVSREDGFKLPQAETVGDDGKPAAQNRSAAPRGGVAIGYAEFFWSEHPPYQIPERARELVETTTPAKSGSGPASDQWRLLSTIKVGEGYLHKARFTPDGQGVVTLSSDSGSFYHFDVKTGQLKAKYHLPHFKQFDTAAFEMVREISFRPQLLVTRESGTLLLDLYSGQMDPLAAIAGATRVNRSAVAGLYEFSTLTTTPQAGNVRLQWLNGEQSLLIQCKERPDDVSLSADGTLLAISYFPSNRTQVYNLKKQELVLDTPGPQWGGNSSISPDGSLLAVGGDHLKVIRVADGKTLGEDHGYKNNIDHVEFTPDGRLLLTSAYDGKVRSYALPESLPEMTKLPVPQQLSHSYMSNVYQFSLDEEGRHLVTPSGDKSLKIWSR